MNFALSAPRGAHYHADVMSGVEVLVFGRIGGVDAASRSRHQKQVVLRSRG